MVDININKPLEHVTKVFGVSTKDLLSHEIQEILDKAIRTRNELRITHNNISKQIEILTEGILFLNQPSLKEN